MADHLGGLHAADFEKPEVLAQAIVNAGEARFSKLSPEQVSYNPLSVMKAAASHLGKREERETGSVHKNSPASKALSEYNKAKVGKGGNVAKELENMERLAYQRMLFPSAAPSASAPGGPRSKQQGTYSNNAGSRHSFWTKQGAVEEVKRAAREWKWLTGLSLSQELASGACTLNYVLTDEVTSKELFGSASSSAAQKF